ncbi:GGDEF domain-containing protein [Syntrophomonas curvata]
MKTILNGKTALSSAINNKRTYKQQRILAFSRLIVACLGVVLSLLLIDRLEKGLIISLALVVCYTSVLFFSKAPNSLSTRPAIFAAIIDTILIFMVCYYSGGLNSPFLLAFLFPVVVCATSPSFPELLLLIAISTLALLLLGITGGFDISTFLCMAITLVASGTLIYILVYNEFQILSSYVIRDGLTGLYTHQYFYDQLNVLVNNTPQPTMFSLIMIDLDDFKRLNDEHGHLEGDRVLKQVADTIKNSVRESDIVARYGGDEFGIILPGVGYELCSTVVERLRSSIIALGHFNHVSIGSALYPDEADEIYQLVDLADIRMYEEKKESRCSL